MTQHLKMIGLITASVIMLCVASASSASLIIDGGFEVDGIPSWTLVGEASAEIAPSTLVNGSQALKLFGDFGTTNEFTVASQFIAVDGINLMIGDEVWLEGLIGHLSGDALEGINLAYIEVAIVNIFGGIDFTNLAQSAFLNASSPTDVFLEVMTPKIEIPNIVMGDAVGFVRVAAVFYQENRVTGVDFDNGAAWFDDLRLNVVPSPSTLALFILGFSGLLLARRTSNPAHQ